MFRFALAQSRYRLSKVGDAEAGDAVVLRFHEQPVQLGLTTQFLNG